MKYRIKTLHLIEGLPPTYAVQVKTWLGIWITIKYFYDEDLFFAHLQAEELLEKLNEE